MEPPLPPPVTVGAAGQEDNRRSTVSDPVESLILDLLEWLARRPRSYAEAIDAWRTSCPRLPVWEEATDRRYVEVHDGVDGTLAVSLTPLGRSLLTRHRGAGGTSGAPGER